MRISFLLLKISIYALKFLSDRCGKLKKKWCFLLKSLSFKILALCFDSYLDLANSADVKYAFSSSQFVRMLYITFLFASQPVKEGFTKGRGVILGDKNSLEVFITSNNWLYASLHTSQWRNQFGFSDNRNPILQGSLATACWMHNANEWQIHRNWTQLWDASFNLLQTGLLQPIMFDAPSEANAMHIWRFWPKQLISCSIALNKLSPVAFTTGSKPTNRVTISFDLAPKYRTKMHTCFCVDMSVDLSIIMVYPLFLKSWIRSFFIAGDIRPWPIWPMRKSVTDGPPRVARRPWAPRTVTEFAVKVRYVFDSWKTSYRPWIFSGVLENSCIFWKLFF